MDRLFALVLVLLIAASIAMYAATPRDRTEVPVLYWVTDPSPNHHSHAEHFKEWLIENGHAAPDGSAAVDIRIDPTNYDITKQVIQGVSGVCGDLVDLGDGASVRYMQSAGLLRDLTDDAARLGIGTDCTYPVLEPELTVDGRQYAFPAQIYAYMMLVNRDAFHAVGMGDPPLRWTWDEFDRIGREFVQKSNPPGKRQTKFFANEVRVMILWRSLGLSIFNETLTECTLDDPRYVRTLELIHKWTYVDHLLPSAADLKAVATQAETQFGDSRMDLFRTGNYAMIGIGRHALPYLRRYDPVNLSVSEVPHGGFPNTFAGVRCVGIYAGSKYPQQAEWFLQYLGSKQYNMAMVLDAEGIPPEPQYTGLAEYRLPAGYPNEEGTHAAFAEAMEIAIGGSYSPFVLPITMYSAELDARQKFMEGLCTAEEASQLAARTINREIATTLEDQPTLRDRYDEWTEIQRRIDQYRAEGKPVPLSWIKNPFHRRYYQFRGWAEKT